MIARSVGPSGRDPFMKLLSCSDMRLWTCLLFLSVIGCWEVVADDVEVEVWRMSRLGLRQ